MITKQEGVEGFLKTGCGRCSHWNTPSCKALFWMKGIKQLRAILLKTELVEELKWGFPCYTLGGKNVVMIGAFRDYFALLFFKGSLIADQTGLLVSAGANSQVGKQIRFTDQKQVLDKAASILTILNKAIEIERSGKKVETKKVNALVLPEELFQQFKTNPEFKKAFFKLTPGRQRGYQIYFSQPKQSATRLARIEKCIPLVMQGIGIHDAFGRLVKT